MLMGLLQVRCCRWSSTLSPGERYNDVQGSILARLIWSYMFKKAVGEAENASHRF